MTAGGITSTTVGEVVLVMHQRNYHGKNKKMHSSPQIEKYKNVVDEKSSKVGCGQNMTALNKHKIPIYIIYIDKYAMYIESC